MINRRRFLGYAAAGTLTQALPGKAAAKKKIQEVLPGKEVEKLLHDPESLKRKLYKEAEAMFEKNRADTSMGLFHMPSAKTYRSFFAWDSGWHVIAMSRLDPELAFQELATVFATQAPDGRIPHEVLAPELSQHSLVRGLVLFLLRRQFDELDRSHFIDPPSFLLAAELLYKKTSDKRVLGLLPAMERCADYLLGPRDMFGDGLVSIVHPWESGTDSAPVFDKPMGIDINSPAAALKYARKYPALLNFCADRDWDLERLAQENRFVFEDVGVNSLTAAGLLSMSELFRAAGNSHKAMKYRSKARSMVKTMEAILWDHKEAFFFPRFDLVSPKRSRRKCLTGLTPLITGLVEEEKAVRVIEENLLSGRHFKGPWLVPFNSVSGLKGEDIPLEQSLLWRGHCIWINMNWMAARAAKNYGREDYARRITRLTAGMVAREGFREFYDLRTGEGGGAKNFTWPALVLDMIEEHGV